MFVQINCFTGQFQETRLDFLVPLAIKHNQSPLVVVLQYVSKMDAIRVKQNSIGNQSVVNAPWAKPLHQWRENVMPIPSLTLITLLTKYKL